MDKGDTLLMDYGNKSGYLTGIALGYGLDDRGFESRPGMGIFLFTTASRPALGPIRPPIQWVPGAPSLRAERPGREDDHSPQSSVKVKECVELYLHSPNMPSWRGAQLKRRDNFTFTLPMAINDLDMFTNVNYLGAKQRRTTGLHVISPRSDDTAFEFRNRHQSVYLKEICKATLSPAVLYGYKTWYFT
jgi:hypothetical protein